MLFATFLFVYNARNSHSRCSNSTKIVVPDPTGGAYPRPPSWIQWAILLRLLLLRGEEGKGLEGRTPKICAPRKIP